MILIAAADKNWGIGRNGQLLVKIPEDQKFFREETLGKAIIVGRRTLETFPNGLALDGRDNIIFSRDRNLRVKDAAVVHSVQEARDLVSDLPDADVYVAGGESVYREFLPYCTQADITRIDYRYDADAFLPDLDADPAWVKVQESEEKTYFDVTYRYVRYVRRAAAQKSLSEEE